MIDRERPERWESLVSWCDRELESPAERMLFHRGHAGNVYGVELADSRQVVVKLRESSGRGVDAIRVQRKLYDSGFPCPRPLGDPSTLDGLTITAETLVPSDDPPRSPPPSVSAGLLASLIAGAGDPRSFPSLMVPLPWVDWNPDRPELWPAPDDLPVDLNHPAGPAWLDETARRVRRRLARDQNPLVIGHGDWEAHNLAWAGRSITAVYDWDSLCVATEPALAGAAATVFASTPGGPVAATLTQTDDFLSAYRNHTGRWDDDATEIAYAAGLWVLLYNTRKELAGGGTGYLAYLDAELQPRLQRSGL